MRSAFVASVLALGLASLAGCTNPNNIGVQTYGSVAVHCVRSSDGTAVPGAYVTVAGITQQADGGGNTQLSSVPVGPELFVGAATGLRGTQAVTIKEGANPDVTISMQPN